MSIPRPLRTTGRTLLAAALVLGLHASALPLALSDALDAVALAASDETHAYELDASAWSYDSSNDVYYQIGIEYCDNVQADAYETLAVFVPGAYFTATSNGDGTYTCTVDESGTVGDYTATSAPIVMPVNTSGYSAQAALTSYSYNTVSEYMEAGIIYVHAGCRGRNNGTNSDNTSYDGGAPWGVTDLKAAVRCLRYNAERLPGDLDAIFSFGHSGGGAQSAVLGASGDSALYTTYLEEIGAAFYDEDGNEISDAIAGAMCWCPITSLDIADEAYEWMMGQYASSGTRASSTWTSALSDDMSEAFATYINAAGLTDEDGTALLLAASDEGIYTSGTYYGYVLGVIEDSLNNFLEDTEFPYSGSSDSSSGPGSDSGPGSSSGPGTFSTLATTYETAADYVESLNSDEEWVTYDESTNTVTITSIEAFVNHCKSASKDVGAFDDLNLGQAENYVFGNGESDALHFDAIMAELLESEAETYATYSDYDSSYIDDYADDMGNTDTLGVATETRQDMYNPMYYVLASEEGYGTSTPAKYWRIRSGIEQGDTSLTTEINLALALQADEDVESVDFETVWEQGHTEAERTGEASENFIEWVAECMGVESTDDGTTDDDTDDGTTDDGTTDDGTTDDGTDDGTTDDGTTGDGDSDDGTTDDGSDDGTTDDDSDDGTDDDADDGETSWLFPDVMDESAWYYEAVYALADLELVTGYTSGSKAGYFGVGDAMTRAQLATILWRYNCPDEYAAYIASCYDAESDTYTYASTTDESTCSGIADDTYWTAAADWCVAAGVMEGYEASDGSRYFKPSGTINLAQLCKAIANINDGTGDTSLLAAYKDGASVPAWAQDAVAWAVGCELAGVSTSTLDSTSSIARERVVTVLYRAIGDGLLTVTG